MIVLRGGTIPTPSGPIRADVAVDGAIIAGIGDHLRGDLVIDCTGCLVGPGFVDVHVHFREPGQTWKEDVESGSHAAAAGGFTAVVPMANTDPATDSPQLVAAMRERGRRIGLVDVHPAAALTRGRQGRAVSPIEDLRRAGVRIFSDDGDSVAHAEVLEEAMVRIGRIGGVVAQHAEDASMTAGGHMHEGTVSARLGIGGLPSEAEERVVARDLALARGTGVHYHVQHVSTAGTVRLVRDARREGLRVTAEAAPHHFTLDHENVGEGNTIMKMYPPLRTAEDVAAVADGVRDGTIDMIATDHAPHSPGEKNVPFPDAPRGIIGLETSAALGWTLMADPTGFFDRMSVAPARLAGLSRHGLLPAAGNPANLVVFDPDLEWTPERFASKSQNSPWLGAGLRGRPVVTIHDGVVTYREGSR